MTDLEKIADAIGNVLTQTRDQMKRIADALEWQNDQHRKMLAEQAEQLAAERRGRL